MCSAILLTTRLLVFDFSTAKAQAASFYMPLLIGINALYVAIRYYVGGFANMGVSSYLVLAIFVAMQVYAYIGILECSVNHKGSDKALVGGSNLDLLAITYLIQFGGLLISTKFYYLLLLIPVWAGYSLYKTFFGGGKGSASAPVASSTEDDDPQQTERRQKRAERRRQKWS